MKKGARRGGAGGRVRNFVISAREKQRRNGKRSEAAAAVTAATVRHSLVSVLDGGSVYMVNTRFIYQCVSVVLV